jgi:dTMP kinase
MRTSAASDKGYFITFEGGEGSGKSTQLKLLNAVFEKSGLPFIATREPGGSPGAEKIRSLLVSGDVDSWDPLTETLLFMAARADHINKLVKPAISMGKTVICDRFFDSTLVYQGIGKGLGTEYIKNLHQIVFGDFMPDLTIILDIDPETGLKRAGERRGNENRFEQLDIGFHQKIREGFLQIAKNEPARCTLLDATKDADILHIHIKEIIAEKCGVML